MRYLILALLLFGCGAQKQGDTMTALPFMELNLSTVTANAADP